MDKFNIVVFGATRDQVHPEILSVASEVSFIEYDVDKIMDPLDNAPEVILCFPSRCEMSTLEIAQTLRMNYPDMAIFFIATDKKDFDKKKLIKNGFTQAYLIPWEKADLIRNLREEAIYTIIPELRNYKPVKVVDLLPDTILDFSMKAFLPKNGKMVSFSQAGDPIPGEKLKKLFECAMNTLFVHKDEMECFRNYTAKTLSKLLKPGAISETEKQEKLETAVRDLISDMFIDDIKENTFSKSQSLLNEVKDIISLLIQESDFELSKKIDLLVNQEKNFYLHLSNVSTFAGLFAIVLKFDKPEQMALAGLLHDIGKINLPQEIADLEESEMGPHALEAYHKHPIYSMDVARSKKMSLPEPVIKAISQHHEKMNGSGYPSKLEGHKISKEGRLLAIADQFDYLTSAKPGQPNMSMAEALIHMHLENSKDPGRMFLDVDMIKALKTFFIK